MAISTILDPRYKFQFAEWAYRRVYGDSHEIELYWLKDKLFTLFDEYANSSTDSTSATKKYCNTSQASNVEEGSNPLMEVYSSTQNYLLFELILFLLIFICEVNLAL